MTELFNLKRIDESIDKFISTLNFKPKTEVISIEKANKRILAQKIKSKENVPQFNRSTMDGYAVKAKDTFGASENLPAFLDLIGEVKMGKNTDLIVKSKQAVKIATGAMIPKGADAVVMVEDTEKTKNTIEVNKAISKGKNIVFIGDDVKKGSNILNAGHKIRPQDIGALAALGIIKIKVYKKINITIFSTGDELINPKKDLKIGKIRDINSYSIGSLLDLEYINIVNKKIIPDNKEKLKINIKQSLKQSDLVLLSGGSSVGTKDLTTKVINELGDPGIIVHGIAIKPGKPTILSVVNDKGIIGLPGHPVSALVVAKKVILPIIEKLIDIDSLKINTKVNAKLAKNVSSTRGREEYLRVSLKKENNEIKAYPITGSSSLIFTLVKADGLLKIPRGKEGFKKDTLVKIDLFD
ncbi:MAG: gephyrin-like molybdotransferase Glp [Bacillota bacterium]